MVEDAAAEEATELVARAPESDEAAAADVDAAAEDEELAEDAIGEGDADADG